MKGSIVNISGRECQLYKNSNAEFLLVLPMLQEDLLMSATSVLI